MLQNIEMEFNDTSQFTEAIHTLAKVVADSGFDLEIEIYVLKGKTRKRVAVGAIDNANLKIIKQQQKT